MNPMDVTQNESDERDIIIYYANNFIDCDCL